MDIFLERKANINAYIVKHSVLKWQVAAMIGIADQTFSKKLRMPTEAFEKAVYEAVDKIVEERKK